MIIVSHKWACGESIEYTIPGASHDAFTAQHELHMIECKECSTNMERSKAASVPVASIENTPVFQLLQLAVA